MNEYSLGICYANTGHTLQNVFFKGTINQFITIEHMSSCVYVWVCALSCVHL